MIRASAFTLAAVLAACGQSGQVYRSDKLGFTITHPRGADVQHETPRHVKFTVLGPDNQAATEITDGFTLTVQREADVPAQASLGAYANAVLRRSRAGDGQIVDEPKRIGIADYKAVRYRHRTALGNTVTSYLFAPETGGHYRITVAISGGGYRSQVQDMLDSLRFEPAAGAPADEVRVALLENPAKGTEPDAGCDALVYEPFQPGEKGKPLATALHTLFGLTSEQIRGHRHFLARTTDTLRLERVVREGSTARVYLSGELSGLRGTCDGPRAAIQIRHTALQVDGIERVELYLNDGKTDLRPDARGRNGVS